MKTNCKECGKEIKYDGRSWRRGTLKFGNKPERCIPCGTKFLVACGALPNSCLAKLLEI